MGIVDTFLSIAVVLSCGWAFCVLADAIECWYMRGKWKVVGFDLWYHNGTKWIKIEDDEL